MFSNLGGGIGTGRWASLLSDRSAPSSLSLSGVLCAQHWLGVVLQDIIQVPTFPVQVIDTVGAGDALSADVLARLAD